MSSDPLFNSNVSLRLQNVTKELKEIEELLISEQLESSVLTDFRDAVNRVRTTAWAVAQVLETRAGSGQSAAVLSLLAAERVRVTYRLCRLIEADFANGTLQAQSLVQLYLAVQDLSHRISEALGRQEDQHATAQSKPPQP